MAVNVATRDLPLPPMPVRVTRRTSGLLRSAETSPTQLVAPVRRRGQDRDPRPPPRLHPSASPATSPRARVGAQDSRLQLLERLAGLDAELVRQGRPRLGVDRDRLVAPTAAVERAHQQPPEPLAGGVSCRRAPAPGRPARAHVPDAGPGRAGPREPPAAARSAAGPRTAGTACPARPPEPRRARAPAPGPAWHRPPRGHRPRPRSSARRVRSVNRPTSVVSAGISPSCARSPARACERVRRRGRPDPRDELVVQPAPSRPRGRARRAGRGRACPAVTRRWGTRR